MSLLQMANWNWRIVQFAFPKICYLAIVLALSAVLWWGHRTHWDLSLNHMSLGASHDDQTSHDAEAPTKCDKATQPASGKSALPLDDSALEKTGIELGRIERHPMPAQIIASGVVSYDQNLRAQLSSRVPGHVWRVERRVGDIVRKGDVLAIIDALEVGKAKGEVLMALVQSEQKDAAFDAIKSVESAVRARQVREAEVAAREARIHAQVCVQALVNMGLPVTLDELTKLNDEQRTRHVQFLGLPSELVATLDASTTSNLVPLAAPFDGMVIGRDLAVGEVVSREQSQIEIADIRKIWVLLEIRKEDLNLVRLGQALEFMPDGLSAKVQGKVDWISSAVDEKTRTLQVRAEVQNPLLNDGNLHQHATHLLRANTFGSGSICVRTNPNALVAPTAAVQFNGEKHVVFIRRGEFFLPSLVEIGVTNDEHTEILSGVEEGDVVATTGSHVLKAEMQLAASAD
jgi:cobalt-zinc-cadmium efflux system membrane fusion protein